MSILDSVFPNYPNIKDAPSFADLIKGSIDEYDEMDLIRKEKLKKYKSIDAAGNIWLIQNPAVWEFNVDDFGKKFRPKAILIQSAKDTAKNTVKLAKEKY